MNHINLSTSGTDHTIWAKGLEFYNDELKLMGKKLLDISSKNTSIEAGKGVEHFQNQFIIQQKNISDLKHEVRNYRKSLGSDALEHGSHVTESFIKEGNELRERYEQLEQIMNTLRHEFNVYLSRWM